MRARLLPAVILVAALGGLALSIGWTAARAGDGEWMTGHFGPGMMGLTARDGGEPVRSLGAARRQAQRFADRLGLETGEVMRFTEHYYVELRERDGRRATEVLVDPGSGAVWLEYGPAMMWNTRYGMMSDFRRARGSMMGGTTMGAGGMMGGGGEMMGGAPGAGPPYGRRAGDVSAGEARAAAQRWLDREAPGVRAGEPEAFPGYFTLHTLRGGRVAGMLSVNAATGAVWFHWWHGSVVGMAA